MAPRSRASCRRGTDLEQHGLARGRRGGGPAVGLALRLGAAPGHRGGGAAPLRLPRRGGSVAYRWLSMVMDIAGSTTGSSRRSTTWCGARRRSRWSTATRARTAVLLCAALRADAGLRVDERVGAAAAEGAVSGAAGDAGCRRAGGRGDRAEERARGRQHAAASHGLRREGAAGGYSARHGLSLFRNPDPLPSLQPLRGHVRRSHRGGERPHHLHPRG